MQSSGSDIGFNDPSTEDSHCSFELQTPADQPIMPENQSFHEPEAPVPMDLDNAPSRFDRPFDQSLVFPSIVSSPSSPFSTPCSPISQFLANAQAEFKTPAMPNNSSTTRREPLPASPQSDPLTSEEDPVVKSICLSIPEEEALTMDSILRGYFVKSPSENRQMVAFSAGPGGPYSLQIPNFPTSEATSLTMPNFDLIPWSEVTTFATPNSDQTPGCEATALGTLSLSPVFRSETIIPAAPTFDQMVPSSGTLLSGGARERIHSPRNSGKGNWYQTKAS
ncbi:hypothetical protein PG990_001848 [Apiospora arundinis]